MGNRSRWLSSLLIASLGVMLAACGGGSAESGASPSVQGFVPAGHETVVAATPEPSPTPSVARTPTPDKLATARANGCQATRLSDDQPANLGSSLSDPFLAGNPRWYTGDQLWLAPLAYGPPGLVVPDWYTGQSYLAVLAPPNSQPAPEISGDLTSDPSRRLDVQPGGVPDQPPTNYDERFFNVTFPEPGCWQLDVTAGSHKLSVVVYVEDYADSPGTRGTIERANQLRPYPTPASCPATSWRLPGTLPATDPERDSFTIGESDMQVVSPDTLLWAGSENDLFWRLDQLADLQLSGHLIDQPATTLRSDLIQYVGGDNLRGYRATLLFSSPGCWQINATAGSRHQQLTLYVYPAACKHDYGTPAPSGCGPP